MSGHFIPRTVVILGLASFFTDISSEMIYPLLPLFVTEVLKASPMSLGIIEGIAEATASLFKVWSGYLTDRSGKRKPLIVGGYSISSLMRPLIGLSTSWWGVLFFRFIDRVGKGIRTSPRDALIADVTEPSHRARAFGVQRGLDHAGSVLGPIVASLLLTQAHADLRTVFLLAAVPAVVSVLVLIFGLPREEMPRQEPKRVGISLKDFLTLDRRFLGLLFAVFIFMLANSSDTFLLLRLSTMGVAPSNIVILWSVLSLVKVLSTYAGGRLSDWFGHKRMLATAWLFYGIVFLGMAFAQDKATVIGCFVAYGIFFGLSEPSERALVADLAPPNRRGISFGYFHLVSGVAALPASLMFGAIWQAKSPTHAFAVAAALAVTAAVIVMILLRKTENGTSPLMR